MSGSRLSLVLAGIVLVAASGDVYPAPLAAPPHGLRAEPRLPSHPMPSPQQQQQQQQQWQQHAGQRGEERDPRQAVEVVAQDGAGADGGEQRGTPRVTRFEPVDLPAGFSEPRTPSAGPVLDPVLADIASIVAGRGAAAGALHARRRGIDWRAGSVFVRVDAGLARRGVRLREASSRALVDGVLDDLAARGGRVRNVVGPHIEAWVPVAELLELAAQPAVRGIRRPWRMRSEATSEGRAVIGADLWDGVVFKGPPDGVRVGIIDLSFKGYQALQGGDLPPADRIFTRSFRDDDELEGDDEHGAAVAEIIHDLEPGVIFYFAAVETVGDINQAIDYFIENGVDLINMSLGCVGCAPGDGTGAAIEVVERAPQAGIPFVTSAGNEADRHWIGAFVDDDNDGMLDFAPGDDTNSFAGAAGDEIAVTLNWDFPDWFASDDDLDLLLLDSAFNVVEQSRARQAGLSGQQATESIVITLPFSDTFHIVVENVQAGPLPRVEVFLDQRGLQYVVPEQSLSVPADGRDVIAVGAVRWSNDLPEPFSSHGPTKDGRMKPELGAPDGVSTESFGPLGFFGTSAAAPHVVGAMALLYARLGVLRGSDALRILTPRLIDVPPVGNDNITGGGRLSLRPPS